MQTAHRSELRRIWSRWKRDRRVPLALAVVFALTQFTALTHNAEYGSDHHHNHQICDFVLHGDRLDAGDVAGAADLVGPLLSECVAPTRKHQIDVLGPLAHGDPRAPPSHT